MIYYKINKNDFEILQKNPFLNEIDSYLYNQTIIKIKNDISELKKGNKDNILTIIIPNEFQAIKYDLVNKFYYVRLFGKQFNYVNIIIESDYKKDFLIGNLDVDYYLSNTY